MLRPDGEQLLHFFAASAYPKQVTEIIPGTVYHVTGYGDSSVILIDTLDTDVRGAALSELIAGYTAKPVKTIIYTHGHPDHRGGAGAFSATQPEIIAFAPAKPPLGHSDALTAILTTRGMRQFGYQLGNDDLFCQGVGIREGMTQGEGQRAFVTPTTLYKEEKIIRTIDGITLELAAMPGETDDQIAVWLPDDQVLCCGDNYYGCWPNLYAIRGSQYRDISAWIDSLSRLISYEAAALLPGHTRPVLGKDKVKETLTNYRDAIAFVLTETLQAINQGLTIEETVEAVTLPERWASLPYLGEFYGTVAWSVRSIYSGYVGWFDGNPTNLNPLPLRKRAEKTIVLMGGIEAVLTASREALAQKDTQWAIELADIILAVDKHHRTAKQYKAQGLLTLAQQETSANGRNYYLAYRQELLAG